MQYQLTSLRGGTHGGLRPKEGHGTGIIQRRPNRQVTRKWQLVVHGGLALQQIPSNATDIIKHSQSKLYKTPSE
jgi:hypothetical protein